MLVLICLSYNTPKMKHNNEEVYLVLVTSDESFIEMNDIKHTKV
jgi:hypothetical protein